jgi:uncharacterized protein
LTIRSRLYDYPVYEANMMNMAEAAPDFEPDVIDMAETVKLF